MESNLENQNGATPHGTGVASLTRMLRILFFCFLALIVGVFVYYFVFSGIFRVDEQNKAMQLRFGVLQVRGGDNGESPILESGKWYWSYPYPVDEVIMVPANKSVSVSTENTFKAWVAPTGAQVGAVGRELRNGVDGYLVAADMHIFHAEWVVSYRVSDPQKFYLNFFDDTNENKTSYLPSSEQVKTEDRLRGHELIIRDLLSDAVLTETATWTTEDLIRASRDVTNEAGETETIRIEECVRSRLAQLVDEIDLGIELQTVTLVGIYQPPAAALQAFNQVNASERNRQTAIQNAETYKSQVKTQATAVAEGMVNEAKAYKETVVTKLEAQAKYFTDIQAKNKEIPGFTVMLYADALGEMLAKVPNKYILHQTSDEGRQQLRLQISQVPESAPASTVSSEADSSEPASAQPSGE